MKYFEPTEYFDVAWLAKHDLEGFIRVYTWMLQTDVARGQCKDNGEPSWGTEFPLTFRLWIDPGEKQTRWYPGFEASLVDPECYVYGEDSKDGVPVPEDILNLLRHAHKECEGKGCNHDAIYDRIQNMEIPHEEREEDRW